MNLNGKVFFFLNNNFGEPWRYEENLLAQQFSFYSDCNKKQFYGQKNKFPCQESITKY